MTSMVLRDSTLESQTTSVNALAHFRVLYTIATAHTTCVFSLLANDTYIIDLASNALHVFLPLHEEFETLRLSVQPTKCVTWSP
jgi:hypothetical protein